MRQILEKMLDLCWKFEDFHKKCVKLGEITDFGAKCARRT